MVVMLQFIECVLSKDFWLDEWIEILMLIGKNIFYSAKEIL